MLVKVAKVGNGKKWHICRSEILTYCGAKPEWISSGATPIAEIRFLCAKCKLLSQREEGGEGGKE